MARIPLFFQETFSTELYGALHDPESESVVAKSHAKAAMSLADILASPGRLPSVDVRSIAPAPEAGIRYTTQSSRGPSQGLGSSRSMGGDTENKGLGDSKAETSTKPKTYKVPSSPPTGASAKTGGPL